MAQIINYRDIPTDKRTYILNALIFPTHGVAKTMQ